MKVNLINTLKLSFLVVLFNLILFSKSIAITPEQNIFNDRKDVAPLPEDEDYSTTPENFHPTNNLRRKAGSPYVAKGIPLVIVGVIEDINNSPVSNVRIKMWQANSKGFYKSQLTDEDEEYDPMFLGSGTTTTDNLGKFSFYTIMPMYYNNRAPHVHVILEHPNLPKPIETELFFANHPRNGADNTYKALSEQQKKYITGKVFFNDFNDKEKGYRAEYHLILNMSQQFRKI